MFGSAILKCSEHQRPFWLTVALSVLLLASVSITIAHAADPARLAHGLSRDLGALRAQLEQIDPWNRESGGATAAFNTDLGDGGPAFQRHSMLTIARAANRRLDRLIEGYRRDGNDARVRTAEALRLTMYDLQRQLEQLARTEDPAEAVVVGERIEALLDRAERGMSVLVEAPRKPPVLPAVATRSPAAVHGVM